MCQVVCPSHSEKVGPGQCPFSSEPIEEGRSHSLKQGRQVWSLPALRTRVEIPTDPGAAR